MTFLKIFSAKSKLSRRKRRIIRLLKSSSLTGEAIQRVLNVENNLLNNISENSNLISIVNEIRAENLSVSNLFLKLTDIESKISSLISQDPIDEESLKNLISIYFELLEKIHSHLDNAHQSKKLAELEAILKATEEHSLARKSAEEALRIEKTVAKLSWVRFKSSTSLLFSNFFDFLSNSLELTNVGLKKLIERFKKKQA